MNDIEKEMLDAILSPSLNAKQSASACYEIHRREMIKLLELIDNKNYYPDTVRGLVSKFLKELKG